MKATDFIYRSMIRDAKAEVIERLCMCKSMEEIKTEMTVIADEIQAEQTRDKAEFLKEVFE
jgi:hypothetical protein